MKYIFSIAVLIGLFLLANPANAQETKPRPSPPAAVAKKLTSGAEVSISYSQPSVKGRTIGKDLEPKEGQVWRTGANEATVFETTKDIIINGKAVLPAGKYSLFTISGKDNWTVIFNKTWKQWGAYDYKQPEDVLRIDVAAKKAPAFAEKMTFDITDDGMVSLLWGEHMIGFTIK